MIIDFRYIPRCGSHAIMNWVANLYEGDVYLMNACEPDGTCHFGKDDPLWDSPVKYKWADKPVEGAITLRSFELQNAAMYLPKVAGDKTFVIVRDPREQMASMIRNRELKGEKASGLIEFGVDKHYNFLLMTTADAFIFYDFWKTERLCRRGLVYRILGLSGKAAADILDVEPNTGGMATGFDKNEDRAALYQDHPAYQFLVNATFPNYQRKLYGTD